MVVENQCSEHRSAQCAHELANDAHMVHDFECTGKAYVITYGLSVRSAWAIAYMTICIVAVICCKLLHMHISSSSLSPASRRQMPLFLYFVHLKKYFLKAVEAASSFLSSLQKQKRARCLGGLLLA